MDEQVDVLQHHLKYQLELFVFLFGLYAAKRKAGLNMALLFGFTFLSGLTLTPLLSSILGMKGGASIVANAFILTTVAFGGLSVFAMNTKRDFSLFINKVIYFFSDSCLSISSSFSLKESGSFFGGIVNTL